MRILLGGSNMQIDRRALEGLLALNDAQLMAIITRLAAQSGIDPAEFNVDPSSISSIRAALSGARDEELARVIKQYNNNLQRGKQQK
jgi:hypothetical protein